MDNTNKLGKIVGDRQDWKDNADDTHLPLVDLR